jgi:hypothetical protein
MFVTAFESYGDDLFSLGVSARGARAVLAGEQVTGPDLSPDGQILVMSDGERAWAMTRSCP